MVFTADKGVTMVTMDKPEIQQQSFGTFGGHQPIQSSQQGTNHQNQKQPYTDTQGHTLNSAYNEKKYAEIFLHYRQLFIKGDIFTGAWEIFCAELFLHHSQFFIKGNFVIDRVECKLNWRTQGPEIQETTQPVLSP